jgi:WD40 repeat protein
VVHLTSSPSSHCSSIQCILPTAQRLYTGGRDGTVRTWDHAFTLESVYRGHTDWVTAMVEIPGDQRLITASNDSTIRLWDTGRVQALSFPHTSVHYHTDYIEALTLCSQRKLLVSGGLDQQLFAWDVETLSPESKPTVKFSKLSSSNGKIDESNSTPLSYYCVDSASASANIVGAGSTDGIVRIWDIRAPEAEFAQLGKTAHGSTVRTFRMSSDGQYVVSGGSEDNACVQLWDMRFIRLNKLAPVWSYDALNHSSVWSIDVDNAFRYACVGGRSNQLVVLDLETRSVVTSHNLEKQEDTCLQIQWTKPSECDPSGSVYVSSSSMGLVQIDLAKNSSSKLVNIDAPIKNVKILSDGISVASQDSDLNIHVWNVVTGQKMKTVDGNSQPWEEFIESYIPEICAHRWFTAEIHLGSLAVSLKNPACFIASLFLAMNAPLPHWCEGLTKVPTTREFSFTNLGEFKVNCGEMVRLISMFRPPTNKFQMLTRIFKALLEPDMEKNPLQQWTFLKTRANTFELLNGYDVGEIEHIVPVWLLRSVLHQEFKLRDTKMRFELLPAPGSGLPKLSKG